MAVCVLCGARAAHFAVVVMVEVDRLCRSNVRARNTEEDEFGAR